MWAGLKIKAKAGACVEQLYFQCVGFQGLHCQILLLLMLQISQQALKMSMKHESQKLCGFSHYHQSPQLQKSRESVLYILVHSSVRCFQLVAHMSSGPACGAAAADIHHCKNAITGLNQRDIWHSMRASSRASSFLTLTFCRVNPWSAPSLHPSGDSASARAIPFYLALQFEAEEAA